MKTFQQYLEGSDNTISRISGSLTRIQEMIRSTMEQITALEEQQPPHNNQRLKQIGPVWGYLSASLNSSIEATKHFSDVANSWKDHNDPNLARPEPQEFKNY